MQIADNEDTSESAFFQDFCERQFPVITKNGSYRSFWILKSFGAGLRIIAKDLMSAWKKIGAFIRHVPILFKCGYKLPDHLALQDNIHHNKPAFAPKFLLNVAVWPLYVLCLQHPQNTCLSSLTELIRLIKNTGKPYTLFIKKVLYFIPDTDPTPYLLLSLLCDIDQIILTVLGNL